MARPHHYAFAHGVLPMVFFEDPVGFLAEVATRGMEILPRIWSDTFEVVKRHKSDAEMLSSDGLTSTCYGLGSETLAVIISLPPPTELTEAYFVGLVVRPPRKRLFGLLGTKKGLARFITLELGSNLDDTSRTVVGEWTEDTGADVSHRNFGDGPEPTLGAFAAKLGEMVTSGEDTLFGSVEFGPEGS